MALKVPELHVPPVKEFLKLSPSKVDELLNALGAAGPVFNTFDLADEIAQKVDVPKRLLSGILSVVAGLYLTRDREGTPIEQFVDQDVLRALAAAQVFEGKEAIESDWPKLRKFIAGALAQHRSVGTASKTGHILTQHERIFDDARILTDMRPIFHADVGDVPDAAVIIHMLRLTQRTPRPNQRYEDIFIAMDSNDIRALRETIDRAIAKEETIKTAMNKADIKCIDPKGVY